MAVYYRYRSGVDTFSVPLATPAISVGDLKRLILGTGRHGHSPREGIAISDALTGRQYTDGVAELVPRNSTVVVRRVPAEEAVYDDEVAKAISVAVELEWEVMTSITAEKQRRSSVASTTVPARVRDVQYRCKRQGL
nr:E3 ubiquitin ligase PARAQUAT TOLERANCE 3-like [Lolium perenne]